MRIGLIIFGFAVRRYSTSISFAKFRVFNEVHFTFHFFFSIVGVNLVSPTAICFHRYPNLSEIHRYFVEKSRIFYVVYFFVTIFGGQSSILLMESLLICVFMYSSPAHDKKESTSSSHKERKSSRSSSSPEKDRNSKDSKNSRSKRNASRSSSRSSSSSGLYPFSLSAKLILKIYDYF